MFIHVHDMPIDFWEGWLTEDQYKSQLTADDDFGRASTIAEYEELRDEAFELARAKGWEGDIRQGPFIAGIPTGDHTTGIMIAWKQHNNGTTFIASPLKLPWLG